MLLRRVLRRRLARVFGKDKVLRRVLRRERFFSKAPRRCLEGRNTSFRRVRPNSRAPYLNFPKDPTILKTLQDSELLRCSVFTTPPILTTVWTLFREESCLYNQKVSARGVAIVNHRAIVNLLRIVISLRRNICSTAGSSRLSGPKKPWQPQTWQKAMRFCPPRQKWGNFLHNLGRYPKLHRKPGEK